MINYLVVPHVGVGPVHLGMTRAESREVMTEAATPSKRYDDVPEIDCYHNFAFQVFFDVADCVESIELSHKEPSFIALYKGVPVHQTKADDLRDVIEEDAGFDDDNPELGYSFVFPTLELSVWRPTVPENADDEDGRYFSTIGIGKSGYYSERKS